MAVLGNTFLSLIDIYKRTDDGKQAAVVIEVLKQMNPILDDAIAVECNNGEKHRTTIRTGLPAVTWGRLYQGIVQSKSTTQQVDDTTGFCEALSTVDTRLLKLKPNLEGAVRLQEANSFLEAMSQEMATGIFYHNTDTTPEKFKGLGARYSATGGGSFGNQIVKAGGSGSTNTSIWFVTWGENYTSLIYPEGSKAGVTREDKGEQRVTDGNGNPYYVKEELFRWHIGVTVRDWRYNARICNIDVTALAAGTVDIYKFMRQAYYRLQSRRVAGGKQVIYMNRTVLEYLDATQTDKTNGALYLSKRELEGEEVLFYRNMPIRESDSLLSTEATVV